jgi:Retroviral aspartyl protease
VHASIGEEIPGYPEQDVDPDYTAHEDVDLIAGTIYISGYPAFTLIDTGASHSFIS